MTSFTRTLLAGAAAAAMLAGAAPLASASLQDAPAAAAAEQTETERLNAWFDQIEQEDLDRSPMSKAQRGIIDEDYGSWGDVSDAFAVETYELGQARLAEMRESFDFDALDPSGQLSWRLYEYQRENDAQNFPFRRHHYVFNQMRGAHQSMPVFLTTTHRIIDTDTAEAWISRAGSVGEQFDTLIEEAQTRFDMGVQPPVWVYDHVIDTARNIITGAPFDEGEPNMVWENYEQRVSGLDIEDAEKERLLAEGREAMLSWVPAYESLIATMEAHKAGAMEGDGVWRLPDGDDFYAARLASFTTTDMTAEEIHQAGLDNVERIHEEMRAIMDEVGYEGSLQEFFVFMREDEQFYYPTTDEGRQAYLDEATAIIDTITERLPEYFITLPEHELEVRRVEEFRERSAGKAFYSRPAPDGSRPGIYYANLYDMADMPIYQMEALAYHEGSPGHHMQLSIMTDLDVPAFRRFGGFTAYTEGWGLYTEYLPLEMGFYEDPYSNFGRLAMELWRAARLVVDTGLHHKQWTREEAIDWLVENTPNSRGDSTRAIERYIVMPGQATAYMIGMIKILELREDAQERLGDRFDIREFHEVVLRDGAVPLEVLEELVDQWVEETLQS
ncbi:DUF885 domain-containing protein [Glycocaulis profundi]|nr:DUF885 domain-containing protein [Glycocaulis profundi]